MSLDWAAWFETLGAELGAHLAATIDEGKPPTDAGAEVLHLAIELERLANEIAEEQPTSQITIAELAAMAQTLYPPPLVERVGAGEIRVEYHRHRHVSRWMIELPGHPAAVARTPGSALHHIEERRRWPAASTPRPPETISRDLVDAMVLRSDSLREVQPDGSHVVVNYLGGTHRVLRRWEVRRTFADDRPNVSSVVRSSESAMTRVCRHRRDGGR